ncbi:hypothetical protein BVY00_02180, partial [bacterium G20]
MLSQNDNDGDGLIGKQEIPDDMLLFSRPEMDEDSWYVKRAFNMIDKNKDDSIDGEEWAKMVETIISFYGESGLMALRPSGRGELPMSQVLWKVKEKVPEVPSPIYYQDQVYMVKNGGIITCVNAENGKVLYQERLGASGPYFASPVAANGNIYVPSSKGVISVIKAGDQLEILAQNDLKEKI